MRQTSARPICGGMGRYPVEDPDELAVEEPLEIRVHGRPVTVTMRTPGHDPDLAPGSC